MNVEDTLIIIETKPNIKRKTLREFANEIENQLLRKLISEFENSLSDTWSNQEVASFLQEKINKEESSFLNYAGDIVFDFIGELSEKINVEPTVYLDDWGDIRLNWDIDSKNTFSLYLTRSREYGWACLISGVSYYGRSIFHGQIDETMLTKIKEVLRNK